MMSDLDVADVKHRYLDLNFTHYLLGLAVL